jgi:hypothetical protein
MENRTAGLSTESRTRNLPNMKHRVNPTEHNLYTLYHTLTIPDIMRLKAPKAVSTVKPLSIVPGLFVFPDPSFNFYGP